MAKSDNPPVGILLCAQKDHALVEYALAGMNNRLFVSRYQLKLPKKEEIRRFLEAQIQAEAGKPNRNPHHLNKGTKQTRGNKQTI